MFHETQDLSAHTFCVISRYRVAEFSHGAYRKPADQESIGSIDKFETWASSFVSGSEDTIYINLRS